MSTTPHGPGHDGPQHDPDAADRWWQPQTPPQQGTAPTASSPWAPSPAPAQEAPGSAPGVGGQAVVGQSTHDQDTFGRYPDGEDAAAPSTATVPAAGASQPGRRGPGWGAVTGMVLAGMLLSSGLTLGGVIGYDAFLAPDRPAAEQSADPSPSPAAQPVAAESPIDWSAVAARVSSSTVAIRSRTAQGTSEGTGVIYREDGTIVTNNHVVSGSDTAEVTLSDGLTYDARVIGADPSTDIAVLRLTNPPQGLKAAEFGDSRSVVVGQSVMAVGTPLGLQNTATTGIISAVDRPVTTSGEAGDGSDATFTSALQTDAAINPGNSGGPLVDGAGRVIGINSSIASMARSQGRAGSIGLGFAIPSDTVRLIADQLIADGTARHAFVGVTSRDASVTVGDVTHQGAQIVEVVPDSPAAKAGLEAEDLITRVDDVPITSAAGLTGVVRGLEIGSTHQLTVIRSGQETTIDITLGAAPTE